MLPPAKPGDPSDLIELDIDVGVKEGQTGNTKIIRRSPEFQKEPDRVIAAEITYRQENAAAKAADQGEALGDSSSTSALNSLESELVHLPAPGQWIVGNEVREVCRHKKVKEQCLICTPVGHDKPNQISEVINRREEVYTGKTVPFDPTTSKLNGFQQTIAMSTALVYSNLVTADETGKETVVNDVGDDLLPLPDVHVNPQMFGPYGMSLDPMLQLGTAALPAEPSSSGQVDMHAAPAIGMSGSSDPMHYLPSTAGSMYGLGTSGLRLPPKIELGRMPIHRSQWERWTWNTSSKIRSCGSAH